MGRIVKGILYFFVTAEFKKKKKAPAFLYMKRGDSLPDSINTYVFRVKFLFFNLKVSLIFSSEKWDIHSFRKFTKK